jgi:hypothetical protein
MIAVRLVVDGAVVRETVFRDGAAVIGRGVECDFPIIDPSVSRQHARVRTDEAGTVWIEDTTSRNGLRIGRERVDRAAVPTNGTLRCRLGAAEVELAVTTADTTLEMPVPMRTAHGPRQALKTLAAWAAGIAAGASLLVISPSFWSPWDQNQLSTLSWVTLTVAVGLPIQAFILIGLLRIVGRRARLGDALRALAFVSWAWVLLSMVLEAASYGLSIRAHALLTVLLQSCGTVVTVAYLASLARRGPRRRFFLTWAAAVAVLLAGFSAVSHLAARQAGMPQLDYEVRMPIGGVTGPSSGLDRYFDQVRSDFERAEARAVEERRQSEASRR